MPKSQAQKFIFLATVSTSVILIDQLIKWAFIKFWPTQYILNSGVAFGLNTPVWLVIFIFIVLVAISIWSWVKEPDHWERNFLGLALILGGAISNLLDRAMYGAVVDYIDLKVWPVFNLADTSIFIGVLLLLWYALVSSNTSHGDSKGEEQRFLKKRTGENSRRAL